MVSIGAKFSARSLTMGTIDQQLLAAFAILFPAVAFMTFDYVVKE